MKKAVFLLGFSLVACLGACTKKNLTAPAIRVTVHSATIPTEDNSYLSYSTKVVVEKTNGSYKEDKWATGSAVLAFESLAPGDYRVRESLTKREEIVTVGGGETVEVEFQIP